MSGSLKSFWVLTAITFLWIVMLLSPSASIGAQSEAETWYVLRQGSGTTRNGNTWIVLENPTNKPHEFRVTIGNEVMTAAVPAVRRETVSSAEYVGQEERDFKVTVRADSRLVKARIVVNVLRSIDPDKVTNDGLKKFKVYGSGFDEYDTGPPYTKVWPLPKVELRQGTTIVRVSSERTKVSDNEISCTIPLAGVAPGRYDVWHGAAYLKGGLMVESSQPDDKDEDGGPVRTSRTWGHDSIGVTSPAQKWYLAEGCTAGGFETWVLVQNPNEREAKVDLTYMTRTGPVTGPSVTLGANSRKTFFVADTVPDNWEVSTKVTSDKEVIAERSMYGPGRAWGHDSVGSPSTSKDWYLAEGCTAGGFETWVLVQNPNESEAKVDLTYMTPGGPKAGPSISIGSNSRKTFNAADVVPNTWEVSTKVTSDKEVIAERSMYWNNRKGGHESVGVSEPSQSWYLAEGCTAGGFETWVLVQNPGDKSTGVDITYMTENGPKAGPHLDLSPQSRKTVKVADVVPDTYNVSTQVTSDSEVIAERAVYWNNRIEGHDSVGAREPSATWYLAEGCTGAGFETWVLVQNPNDAAASIEITYMTPGGPVEGPAETISPNSRISYNVADTLPGEAEVSTLVTSTNEVPIICERAMYGDAK